MGVVAAILGLAMLVMIHEAGHFFAARAVGMTPRKFYLGFGPPIAKTTRGGVEYGIGSIPLGGYVKIPGMNRPSPGDLAATLPPGRRASATARSSHGSTTRSSARTTRRRTRYLAELRPALGETRMWQELEWSLAPDAYWRQATWRRLTAIFAGPAVNLVFAVVLFACLFMVAAEREHERHRQRRHRQPRGRRARPGRATAILRDRRADDAQPDDIPAHIRATNGRPFRLVVLRNGKRVVLGPLRAKEDNGAFRIGIAIEARTGPGESPPAAIARRVEADVEHHCRDGARNRASRDRPRHQPGVELRRDRARLRAGLAAGLRATSSSCSAWSASRSAC